MNTDRLAFEESAFATSARAELWAGVPQRLLEAADVRCHKPDPLPPADDDDDEEEDDDDRGSSGGNIDPDDDEGGFDEDEDDEDETLWTGRRGMFVIPAPARIQVA